MSRIIDALMREHQSMATVLGVLESEIANLAEFKGRRRADYRLVWSAIDYFTDFPDLVHHPKEDLLFDRLRQTDPAAAHTVGDIPAAHVALAKELGALAVELKAAMENHKRPRAGIIATARGFAQHLRRHMEMEEALFFPTVERSLDPGLWAELENRMTARLDPLIGGESGERFEALRRTIVSAVAAPHPSNRH